MFLKENIILCRLLFALIIGMAFGLERELRRKPIGARTHILISLAACTLTIISAYGFVDLESAYSQEVAKTDPARLIVGMLTGMGFIGAGIIYKTPHGNVKGITTATEFYLIAVLGIGAGLGLYFLTIASSVISYIVLACSSDKVSFMKNKMPASHDKDGQTKRNKDGTEAEEGYE